MQIAIPGSASIPTYHIDVPDGRRERHYFSMVLSEDNWTISSLMVSDWVLSEERILEKTVLEYKNSTSISVYGNV